MIARNRDKPIILEADADVECCRDREIDGMRLDDILAVSAAHQLVALGVCIESHPPYRYPFPKWQRMPQRQ